MTGVIFSSWLTKVNLMMKKRHRHILLFMDNASCHSLPPSLSNVSVHFLPKNVTSLIQPLDQGIIQNLKQHFRKMLLSRVLSALDVFGDLDLKSVVKSLTVLDAMHMVRCAWDKVTPKTIQNCFLKAHFAVSPDSDSEDEEGEEGDEQNDPEDEEFQAFLDECGISEEQFSNYTEIDKDEDCFGELTEEDIAEQVKLGVQTEDADQESDDDDEVKVPDPIEIAKAFDIVRKSVLFYEPESFSAFNVIESKVMRDVAKYCNMKKKQQKITSYFLSEN